MGGGISSLRVTAQMLPVMLPAHVHSNLSSNSHLLLPAGLWRLDILNADKLTTAAIIIFLPHACTTPTYVAAAFVLLPARNRTIAAFSPAASRPAAPQRHPAACA
jgi:hypothetical protein